MEEIVVSLGDPGHILWHDVQDDVVFGGVVAGPVDRVVADIFAEGQMFAPLGDNEIKSWS